MTLPPKAIVLVAILLPAGYTSNTLSMDTLSVTDSSTDDGSTSDSMTDSVVPGPEDDPLAPCLVGTVELSFSETTRYKYLTLNPPAVRYHSQSLLCTTSTTTACPHCRTARICATWR